MSPFLTFVACAWVLLSHCWGSLFLPIYSLINPLWSCLYSHHFISSILVKDNMMCLSPNTLNTSKPFLFSFQIVRCYLSSLLLFTFKSWSYEYNMWLFYTWINDLTISKAHHNKIVFVVVCQIKIGTFN